VQGLTGLSARAFSALAALRLRKELARMIWRWVSWLSADHVVSILRPSLCFFVASIECMGCTKANGHTKLASRLAGNHREVAAYLVGMNLEEQEKYEGDVGTLSDLLFRSQDPSMHQERFFLKK